jgi:hypothetical protein
LGVMGLAESSLTIIVITGVLWIAGFALPVAGLVAAIVVSSSPAVLLHVAHEVRASGDVTETTKTLVAINNVVSFVAFSACCRWCSFLPVKAGARFCSCQPTGSLAHSFWGALPGRWCMC